jgi:hypothetical protein
MCANYKEIDWETEKIWEAMATAQNFTGAAREISIRTYVGARENPQYHAMICAWKEMEHKLAPKVLPYFFGEPEYLFIEQVNRRGMGVEDIIDWLLAGDIHFIICHIHQGFASHGKVLDMVQVKEQLKRLWFHPGFPKGIKLTCPVLTQDKRGYLDALGVGTLTNFTKFIYLRDLGDFSQEVIADLRMYFFSIFFLHVYTSFFNLYLCITGFVRPTRKTLASWSKLLTPQTAATSAF